MTNRIRGKTENLIMIDDKMCFPKRSFPNGELFSLSGENLFNSPKINAYWKARYGRTIKLHNLDGNTSEYLRYTFINNKFIKLCIYDLNTGKIQFFDNDEEISTEKFLEKVNALISFI